MDESDNNVFSLEEYRKIKEQRHLIDSCTTTEREKELLHIIEKLSGFVEDIF